MLFTKRLILSLSLALFASGLFAQTFVFAELQGQPTMNTAGWNLTGAAYVGETNGDADFDPNELILTDPVGTSSGAIFYNQPLNLSICTKWTAEFEFRIWEGSGADGIAFCFLDVPPTGFVSGGGVGIPVTANGLKIVFDPYDNGCGANPEIQLLNAPGYNECDPTIVKVNNTGGNLNFIRSNAYNSVQIIYNNGNITVTVNGTTWINTFSPVNFSGYLGFTSSTGGSNDRHSIRNVTIYADIAESDAGPDIALCTGVPGQIGTATNPTYTYSWTPSIGLNQTNISNPTVTQTNTGTTPLVLTYYLTTTITGTNSCPNYDTVQVTIYPNPTSTFTLSETIACLGEPVTVTYTGTGQANATYAWNFGTATVISGSGQGPYQISWNTPGPQQVTLSVTQNGCPSNVTTRNITIQPNPVLTVNGPTAICLGDTALYTASTDLQNTVISWTPGNLTGSPQLLNPSTSTSYTVQAVSAFGCLSNDTTFTLTVKPIPVAQILGDTLICKGDSTLLDGFSSLAGSSFLWLPDLDTTANIWANPLENQIYGLVVSSDGCISDTAQFLLQVDSVPNIQGPDSLSICKGETINVTVSTTTPDTQFLWLPGNLTGTSNILGPDFTTTYEVYAYNANCTSDVKLIELEVIENCDCELVIPNIFTPNGDQVNDEFSVLNPQNCNVVSFDFKLYNRWGDLVWKGTDINQPFIGKCLMGNCSDGTYYWVFEYSYAPGGGNTTKTVIEKGILTLVK